MNSNKQITKEAIQKFNDRQESGFKEIFDCLYIKLRLYAYAITRDLQESEDIVMRVLSKFWKSNNKFKSEESIRYFLYRSIKNETISYMKSVSKRMRKCSIEINCQDWPTKEEDHMGKDRAISMHAFIEELPTACKNVIKMQLAGIGTKQIVAITKTTKDTVHNHRHHAIAKLKKLFGCKK